MITKKELHEAEQEMLWLLEDEAQVLERGDIVEIFTNLMNRCKEW